MTIKDDGESDETRTWVTTRTTVGHVVLSFEAFPRNVNKSMEPGPRLELAKDQGGLIGSGISFLPLPINGSVIYDINLAWNFELAPAGTTAVWAFGEGDTDTRHIGPATDLAAFYAIGPINSYSRPVKDYGMYWFGNTPFDSTSLAKEIENLLSRMLEFFEESEPTFRVFIRKAEHRSFGGTGSEKSFLLEYDDDFRRFIPINDQVMKILLCHEMVHEWPLIDSGDDLSRGIEASAAWFDEGIANYYQAILSYRFGLFSRTEFIRELNSITSAYYTSPAIWMNDHLAEKLAWEDAHAQRIPYSRGAMFLLKLDAELRAASRGERSLDDPIVEIVRLKNARNPYGLEQWLSLIEAELGENSTTDFKEMLTGKMVILPPDTLEYLGLKLVRQDQEKYELGFDERSASNKVITGLVPGSRAEAAGLREGDILDKSYPIWLTADDFEMPMVVRVVRGDEIVTIEYMPRTWNKVESYQWIDERQNELK